MVHISVTPTDDYCGPASGSWRAIDWDVHQHQAQVRGHLLTYADVGPRDSADVCPLLLLHGHGATWQYWIEVMAQLSTRRRVIAIDLPGFGASEPLPFSQVSIVEVVATIAELLNQLGISRCDLVGHSLGSIFAIEVAAAHADRVNTLTLAGGPPLSMLQLFQRPISTVWRQPRLAMTMLGDMLTAGLAPPQWLRRLAARNRFLRRLAFGAYVVHPTRLPNDLAEELMRGLGAAAYFHVPLKARRYRIADFGDVQAPVMLVNGGGDRFVPRTDIDAFVAAKPDATSYLIADAGHLVTVEHPTLFADLVGTFTTDTEHRQPHLATVGGYDDPSDGAGRKVHR